MVNYKKVFLLTLSNLILLFPELLFYNFQKNQS